MTAAAPLPPSGLWYTRCAVPTASGIAYDLGWLQARYRERGVSLGILQDAPLEISCHHYDHALPGLIREGGNVPAIVTRAAAGPTRLIGLTWIDEGQVIVVHPDSGILNARDLQDRRLAVPAFAATRAASHQRAMALAGFESALRSVGLSLNDARITEIPTGPIVPPGHLRPQGTRGEWKGIDFVVRGEADAAYVKGAAGLEAAKSAGLIAVVRLDDLSDRRLRVNNGTPRPITVHLDLLDSRPEWVVDFMELTLRAAKWAAGHEAQVRSILARETGAGALGVDGAYANGFHTDLAPSLAVDRLELMQIQIDFLARHGFLEAPLHLADWVDNWPLEQAHQRIRSDPAFSLRPLATSV